ncbi:CMP-sialic acid transporter 1-like [Salvia splendens]|uniref:CMP-sialic acid transporter 1-like n=1 Tax=Salvia splendens TaxID=180675 RepID=UPI001C27B5A3|nr:CMP-sialic acid transporter 1-like [Salvia splendens]
MQWYVVASFLTILTSSQGILTTLSQSNGGYKYDYATVPFLAEVFKLIVSSMMLWRECQASTPPKITTDWRSVRLYPIPSVIYLIHNNVQFATLTYVDTSTYQIMGNLKIVTTGILFSGWLSFYWLLEQPQARSKVVEKLLQIPSRFGAMFNMAKLTIDDFRSGFENGPWWRRLFNGYSATTWLVVLNLGSTGLLVSWLMKYADNIVKVYSTSMAMLLTMLVSVYIFNFKPTLQLFLRIIICMMSLHMYFAPPTVLVDLPLTAKASTESVEEVSVDQKTTS